MNSNYKNLPGNILNNNKSNYLKSGSNFHKQGIHLLINKTNKKNFKKLKVRLITKV